MPIPPDSVVSTTLNVALLASAAGVVDGPQLDALCDCIAQVITATIKEGTVTAAGTSAPGGGPVTVVGAVT